MASNSLVKVSVRWPKLPFGTQWRIEEIALKIEVRGLPPNLVRSGGTIPEYLLPRVVLTEDSDGKERHEVVGLRGLRGLRGGPGTHADTPVWSFRRQASHMIPMLLSGFALVVLRPEVHERPVAELRRIQVSGREDSVTRIDILGGRCEFYGLDDVGGH